MKNRFNVTAALLLFLSIASIEANATILWDESVDGSSAGLPTLTLQEGSNEILGSDRWVGTESDPFIFTERDWYDLVLEDGLTILSISSEILNPLWITSEPPENNGGIATWTLQDSSNAFFWEELTPLGDTEPSASNGFFPVSQSGRYLLNQSAGMGAVGSWDISWQYRVVVDVVQTTAVPEPSAAMLLLASLFGLRRLSKR